MRIGVARLRFDAAHFLVAKHQNSRVETVTFCGVRFQLADLTAQQAGSLRDYASGYLWNDYAVRTLPRFAAPLRRRTTVLLNRRILVIPSPFDP